MEDVLAKLGFGEVNEWGVLVPGTETFDLYNRDQLAAVLADLAQMQQYDLIFLNCGADEFPLWTDRAAAATKVRAYVEGGGRLYVTDLAYDYVEQAFPAAIDFIGSDRTPVDQRSSWWRGGQADHGECHGLDTNLRSWLVESGRPRAIARRASSGSPRGGPSSPLWVQARSAGYRAR